MMHRESLFSDQASGYARYRPGYPDTLYQYLSELCVNRDRALDVATGNGQVACKIARVFGHVDAIDISEQQLAHAVKSRMSPMHVFPRKKHPSKTKHSI